MISALERRVRNAGSARDGHAAVERFWAALGATPLIEPGAAPDERIVTFVWRDGEASRVLLFANRLTDERALDDTMLQRLAGTDVWHASFRMGSDWRASYSFLRELPGARAPWLTGEGDQVSLRAALDRGVRDPGNPQTSRNRAGTLQSVVALPDAPEQRWLSADGVPRGEVVPLMGPGRRRMWLHRPASASGHDRLPLAVVLDGDVWTGVQDLPSTIDALVGHGAVRPFATLFVAAGERDERWQELGARGAAVEWLADDVLPWVRSRTALSDAAADVAVIGQSLGGATALAAAADRPDAFGGVVSQSASLWQPGAVERAARIAPSARVHLEVGAQEWVLTEPHRRLRAMLARAGVRVDYREYNGGHDYACWRGGIADGLRMLFPPPP